MVLDRWEPSHDCEDEDDFRDDPADYLETHTECEIEITPGTSEGKLDILVDDLEVSTLAPPGAWHRGQRFCFGGEVKRCYNFERGASLQSGATLLQILR